MKTQVDFLKIKLDNVRYLDKQFLVEHPTIKGRFNLNNDLFFNGKPLYGQNVDIYFNEQKHFVIISTSIPYLLNGHNYCDLSAVEIKDSFLFLSQALKVELLVAIVKQYEVAYIHHTSHPVKEILNGIVSVRSMTLQKKDSLISIYGNGSYQFKVYDVKSNLKRKVGADLFESIDFESENCLKTELKYLKPEKNTLSAFLTRSVHDSYKSLNEIIFRDVCYAPFCDKMSGEKFDDILLHTLLKIGITHEVDVNNLVLQTINQSNISDAKKTARRKTLALKQTSLIGSDHQDYRPIELALDYYEHNIPF